MANSRYKDFYDIYVLADRYDLDGNKLKNSIIETFSHRGTGFDDISAFNDEFSDDIARMSRWNSFVKKKKAMLNLDFKETMSMIKTLLVPVVDAIQNDVLFVKTWDKDTKHWF